MSTHGQTRHVGGVGGVRVRTTHYSEPVDFATAPGGSIQPVYGAQNPEKVGMPVSDSRSGEAIQVPDLGSRIVQTGHFDTTAAAPQVNNNPLEPTIANVIIDEDGIHITDGALYLTDYGGASVLGPAGFDGSWVEFITNGVYNGGFNAGITNWTIEGELGSGDAVNATTIVSGADSAADYLASLSAAVPYWIVSDYSSADTSILSYIVADSTNGRFLNIERLTGGAAKSGGYITFMQDVPVVEGVSYDWRYQIEANLGAEDTDTAEIEISRGWRSSTHAEITAASMVSTRQWNSTQSQNGEWLQAMGVAPPNAKYMRVILKFSLAASPLAYGAAILFFGAAVTPKVWSADLRIGKWAIAGDEGPHYIDTLDAAPNVGRLRIAGGLGAYVENLAYPAVGGEALVLGPGGLGFAAGSASAIDVSLSRGAANRLDLASGDGLRIGTTTHWGSGTSFPTATATGDRFFNTTHGMEYYWSGTYWLSMTEHSLQFPFWTNYSGTPNAYYASTWQQMGLRMFITNVVATTYVGAPNDTTNYWAMQLWTRDGGTAARFAGNPELNTYGHTNDIFVSHGTYLGYLLATNYDAVEVVMVKVAAPGVLYGSMKMYYRVVGQ